MFTLEQCRELIPEGETLTDEEIAEIRKDCYETAQLAFEVWIEKKKRAQK
jgi:hypothetical protein